LQFVSLREEVGAFLRSRRRRLDPAAKWGAFYDPARRRTSGLTRSEVAVLANISVQYYTRIEQGRLDGVSDSVLLAVADALELSADDRRHLLALARGPSAARFRPWSPTGQVRAETQAVLDAITAPALVKRPGADILAANEPAHAVFSVILDSGADPPNNARFIFLDPAAKEFFANWEVEADTIVAVFHTRTAEYPDDGRLRAIIAELTAQSPEFAARWQTYPVAPPDHTLEINHPTAGPLALFNETFLIPDGEGLHLIVRPPANPATAQALATLTN
jgi:transcriptional regulator with XRE-family HTH domain